MNFCKMCSTIFLYTAPEMISSSWRSYWRWLRMDGSEFAISQVVLVAPSSKSHYIWLWHLISTCLAAPVVCVCVLYVAVVSSCCVGKHCQLVPLSCHLSLHVAYHWPRTGNGRNGMQMLPLASQVYLLYVCDNNHTSKNWKTVQEYKPTARTMYLQR